MLPNLMMILQIVVPLLGGLICFLIPKRFAWLFTSIVMLFTTTISFLLFKTALNNDPLFYHLGGWGANVGIQYKLDKLNSFFILFVSLISSLNIIASRTLTNNELDEKKISFFFGLYLIAITGLLGVSISNDIFNIYVLLEVNALASYALVASAKKTSSKKAAFKYLIFGTIGSTFILFGIGFIYALTGSLNLIIISNDIPGLIQNKAALTGMGLILIGILMKSALFPLSNWLVDIYQEAPSFISSMLASTSNKIGIYLFILFFFYVFKLNQFSFAYLEITLLATAIIAIFSCAILASKQTNIKRFLAYSSLSQVGFIILSIALASNLSISGALIYCFTHALEKTVLFLAVGYAISSYSYSENIEDFAGLARKHRWLASLILINLFSTVGIPMTAGFVGKWQILKASLASDIWYILIISVAVLFTFSYVFKLAEILILKESSSEETTHNPSKLCLWTITAITILNLYIGINNNYLLKTAQQISETLIK